MHTSPLPLRALSRFALGALPLLLAAACSRDATTVADERGQAGDPLTTAPPTPFQGVLHRVEVNVKDPGNGPVPGIVVTATEVTTGVYHLALTDAAGRAVLEIPGGRYLVHARNLGDIGPAVPEPLAIAPLPESAGLLATSATQEFNRLAVLWDPTAATGSVPLDPDNYSRLTVSPPLILSGASSLRTIELRFLPGASLDCSFLDATGNSILMPTTENVFVILPHGPGPIPPLPPSLADSDLPRGILLGVVTVPSGQSTCVLQGFTQGNEVGAVIETNVVPVNDGNMVFVGLVPPADVATNAGVTLLAEPQRSSTSYLLDPIGDRKGDEEIELVTYGWSFVNQTVGDNFLVTARFQEIGRYTLEVRWTDPLNGSSRVLRAIVRCRTAGCALVEVVPSSLAGFVSLAGATLSGGGALRGSLTWHVALPGVDVIEFLLEAGGRNISDAAPDAGTIQARKTNNGGNTWIVPGD